VLIRYAQRVIPLGREVDGFTSVRTEFGPGCRELLRRAYLIEAAMSLAEGRGPLVTR
jgi:hypothetical protein